MLTKEIITTKQVSDTGPIVAVKPRKLFGLFPPKERGEQPEAPTQESHQARAEAKKEAKEKRLAQRKERRASAPASTLASTLASSPAFVPTIALAPVQQAAHVSRWQAFKKSIVSWSWARKLVFWIILSAGMVSELAFLLASVWVSVNANVHPFIVDTLHISEEMTRNITYLSTTAYVALPECIVGLAVITTIGHIRTATYNPRAFWPWLWSVLYGIPAAFFLILSMITLSNAVANVNFTMPQPWVSIRALAAFSYAFTSLLYVWLGEDQEKDRLAQKDAKIAELERITGARIAELTAENQRLTAVIEQMNSNLARQEKANSELVNALNKSSEDALGAYSEECKQWLRSNVKSVNVDAIVSYTGHSKRKVNNAIAAGKLQSPGRNKDLILVSSLVKWLVDNPPLPANEERDTGPMLRVVHQ